MKMSKEKRALIAGMIGCLLLPFSLHGFPAPFRRRFSAHPYGVIAGYPMQTVMRFSKCEAGTATKKSPQNRPVMPSLFRKVLPVGYVAT